MRKRRQKKNRQKGGYAREKRNENYGAENEEGQKLKEEKNNVREGEGQKKKSWKIVLMRESIQNNNKQSRHACTLYRQVIKEPLVKRVIDVDYQNHLTMIKLQSYL